jgi:uncharacterized membrane protein
MSPPRIDVHLLTLDEPQHWREECLASLAGAPIRLHLLPGLPGRVGQASAAGFARGSLPLVSFVDPDDRYEAGAFAHLADALDACPSAVLAYTDEALIDEQGRPVGVRRLAYSAFQHAHSASHVHGLIVMRRAAVEAVLAATTDIHPMADWLLTRLVAQRGKVLHLPIVGRRWRQHPRQVHRTADPSVIRRIRQTIRQTSNPWR